MHPHPQDISLTIMLFLSKHNSFYFECLQVAHLRIFLDFSQSIMGVQHMESILLSSSSFQNTCTPKEWQFLCVNKTRFAHVVVLATHESLSPESDGILTS